MRINHEDLDKQKVATFISKCLKFSLIGKPWIANNGRHFVTVGFKTWTSEYEKWKINSVNWREPGIRAVAFSRLYHDTVEISAVTSSSSSLPSSHIFSVVFSGNSRSTKSKLELSKYFNLNLQYRKWFVEFELEIYNNKAVAMKGLTLGLLHLHFEF